VLPEFNFPSPFFKESEENLKEHHGEFILIKYGKKTKAITLKEFVRLQRELF